MSATTGRVPLRIDFVSDIVCPWCAIGLDVPPHSVADLFGVRVHRSGFAASCCA